MQLKVKPALSRGASLLGAPLPRQVLRAWAPGLPFSTINSPSCRYCAARNRRCRVVCTLRTGLRGSRRHCCCQGHGPARVLVNGAGIGVAQAVIGRGWAMPRLAEFDNVSGSH